MHVKDTYAPRTADGLLAKLEALIERARIGLITGDPVPLPLKPPRTSLPYEEMRARGRAASRRYHERHRDKIIARKKAAYDANPARVAAYQKKHRDKMSGSISYRLCRALRTRLWGALKRNSKRSGALIQLGCSIEDFKIYLESKFEPGMSWENYAQVWEIDHVMPCAIFDLSNPEHQKRCFHFSNLQPLFKADNRRKSGKYPIEEIRA